MTQKTGSSFHTKYYTEQRQFEIKRVFSEKRKRQKILLIIFMGFFMVVWLLTGELFDNWMFSKSKWTLYLILAWVILAIIYRYNMRCPGCGKYIVFDENPKSCPECGAFFE